MSGEVIRYWLEKDDLCAAKGNINKCGSFSFSSALGLTTKYKGYHFETRQEAILSEVNIIDSDILALQNRKKALQMLNVKTH